MDKIFLSVESFFDYEDKEIFGVNFFINGRDLRDIINDIEKSYFEKQGKSYSGDNYFGLWPELIFLPSRHLLDKPDPSCTEDNKRAIYRCTCGDLGCNPMFTEITLSENYVIWNNFMNPWHTKKWLSPEIDYSALSFTFERKQYESELSKRYMNQK